MAINYLSHLKKYISTYIEYIELNAEELNISCVPSEQEEYDKLLDFYINSVKQNPSDASAYYNLGQIRHKKGKFKEAIREFDKALELEPNFSFAYVARGESNASLQSYDASLADFNKAISLNPNNSTAYSGLGNV